MNLQKLVCSIIEAVTEPNYSENIEDINILHETYEDTLALAVINSILIRYNDDLNDTYRTDEDRNKDRNKSLGTNNSEKLIQNKGNKTSPKLSGLDINQNLKDVTARKNVDTISDTFSSVCTSSDTSSSSSCCSSYSSSSSADSTTSSTSSPSLTFLDSNQAYDSSVELYLTQKNPEMCENWTLKSPQKLLLHQKISLSLWKKRLNVRESLIDNLKNLTDDVKNELEKRNCKVLQQVNLSNSHDENENELTGQKFYKSVWFWTSQTLVCQDGEYLVKLGEDIGESSTDHDETNKCVDDNSLIPVKQAVRMFEALKSF